MRNMQQTLNTGPSTGTVMDQQIPNPQSIGLKGSACGGTLHLPCGQGTACMNGTCQSVVATPIASSSLLLLVGKAGESCDEAKGVLCQPPLYCQVGTAGSSCAIKGKDSPQILSATYDGLQPEAKGDIAIAGQPINADVTASNAIQAQIVLFDDTGRAIKDIALNKDTNAHFTGSFELPAGFSGNLVLIISDQQGDTNSLLKRVASAN